MAKTTILALLTRLPKFFFPWKDPIFDTSDASTWTMAVLTALLVIVPGGGEIASVVVNAIADFVEAGVQQLALEAIPDPSLNVLQGMALLKEAVAQAGQSARQTIESWRAAFSPAPRIPMGRPFLTTWQEEVMSQCLPSLECRSGSILEEVTDLSNDQLTTENASEFLDFCSHWRPRHLYRA